MQNGNVKLKELFNGDRIFNIPKYQRTYAWIDENIIEFLEDLSNQRGSKSYFLGTILFHQKQSHGEYEILDIVDGQQRLTTIMIFMKVIIKILEANNSSVISSKTFSRYIFDGDNYKLELENEDNSFLQNSILGDIPVSTTETPSQTRLINAKKLFEKTLSNYSKDKLESIYEVLVNSDIILYIVDKISDATQIFELLNDRGRKLTNLEGVKSFLMYRIGCLHLKDGGEQATNTIQDNFSSIYRTIEKYNINENDVLRYHTIAFENSKTDDYNAPVKFIKNKVNNLFETNVSNDDHLIKDEILQYVERLKNSFNIYKVLIENKENYNSMNQLLMIGRVKFFYPLMMFIYKKNKNSLDTFVNDLVKFTFRASLIGLRNDNEGFYSYIRKGEDFEDLFKWVVNDNWWNINARVEEHLEFNDFYNWINKNTVKYILFSYENYLRSIKGYPLLTVENYFTSDKREKLNIEHITAQRTKSLDFDDEFEENYLHSIGNLVIDTTSSNSRKNNGSVDKKMSEFIKAPLMSQNEINESSTKWDNLDDVKNYIEERRSKIINFIKKELL